MSKLSAFLRTSPAGKKKEVFLDRFVDEEGKKVPFVVRSITAGENDAIARRHRDEDGRLDDAAYGNDLLVECLVEPDLKDAELCQYYGVMDPNMVPGRMFSPGELRVLQSAVYEVNDIYAAKKKLEEAKNS